MEYNIEYRVSGENLLAIYSEKEKVYELYRFIPEIMRNTFSQGSSLFLGLIERDGEKQKVLINSEERASAVSDIRIDNKKIFLFQPRYKEKKSKIVDLKTNKLLYYGTVDFSPKKEVDKDFLIPLWDVYMNEIVILDKGILYSIINGEKEKIIKITNGDSVKKLSVNSDGIYIYDNGSLLLYNTLQKSWFLVSSKKISWFNAIHDGGVFYFSEGELVKWLPDEENVLVYKTESQVSFITKSSDSILIVDSSLKIIEGDSMTSIDIKKDQYYSDLRGIAKIDENIILYYDKSYRSTLKNVRREIRIHPKSEHRSIVMQLYIDAKISAQDIHSIVREDLDFDMPVENMVRNQLFAFSLLKILGRAGFDEAKRIFLYIQLYLDDPLKRIFLRELSQINPVKTLDLIIEYKDVTSINEDILSSIISSIKVELETAIDMQNIVYSMWSYKLCDNYLDSSGRNMFDKHKLWKKHIDLFLDIPSIDDFTKKTLEELKARSDSIVQKWGGVVHSKNEDEHYLALDQISQTFLELDNALSDLQDILLESSNEYYERVEEKYKLAKELLRNINTR